jgi:acetoin utilization deacetylase AcuC-like enzyme
MNVLPTGIVSDPVCKQHHPGAYHPECPARIDAVMSGIETGVPQCRLETIPARPATDEDLHLCHTPGYVRTVRQEILSGYSTLTTGDTDISAGSWEAACLAAGGMLEAVDAVMQGRVRNAFCIVRPPGHHATSNQGMGFCVFNNIALGARYAQRVHGVDRVLIADWDVHHGNGTQEIFYEDPSVFFFSTHQWPLYPGTGTAGETGSGGGKGFTMNCPFPRGSGREEIIGAFRSELLPAMDRFRPDLVLISAGFDSRIGDPLGGFVLTDDNFAELTGIVMDIANRHCKGRLVSILEGGYNLSGLASASAAHVGRMTS